MPAERTCAHCGQPFTATRSRARYCSRSCANAARPAHTGARRSRVVPGETTLHYSIRVEATLHDALTDAGVDAVRDALRKAFVPEP